MEPKACQKIIIWTRAKVVKNILKYEINTSYLHNCLSNDIWISAASNTIHQTLYTWLTLESDREMTKIAAGTLIGVGLETGFFGNYGHGVKNWNSHSHKQHYCSSHFVLFKTQSRKKTFSSQNPWKVWRSYEATLVRGVWDLVRCLFLHIDECGGDSGYQGWGFSLLQYPGVRYQVPRCWPAHRGNMFVNIS